MAELTEEQIAKEEKFLKGLPRLNIGALLLAPIWGPAHGFWVTILYYPAWLFVDNLLFATYLDPTPLSIVASVSAVLAILVITVVFSIISQPIAAHRAEEQGKSRETYLRQQRYWAIGCAIGAVVAIALASVYNLTIRTEV
ncbi:MULTISPECIES: viscotoxin-A3 [unclassified Adlercreutzia]|uniref:viscotoxin-A3 n=1 Tax=unclassified Adlercreutzia TaxID=2636013 RepID=UPI0013E9D621|nr:MULTISPECIES: viscotoxin-A3 [unclassified Adlercreutzia]